MSSVLPEKAFARWLLIFVLIAGIYFFSGFLVPVLAALIIGFASWPLYERLLTLCRGNTAAAATLALLVILTVLVIPIAMAFSYALQEARQWIEWLIIANRDGAAMPEWISALPGIGDWLTPYWEANLSKPHALGEWVQVISGEHLGNIYRWALAFSGKAFHLALTLLFMLITLFFIYKDGIRLSLQLDKIGERILPDQWQRFSRVVPATISSTVIGMGVIALGEGVILGIAYAIAGVPSPVALGVITGFMALIPGGAPLAFTLVSLYLFGSGHVIEGIALFMWGSIELFIVDKTLRPRLVGGPIKLPFLPTFFGLIGGVQTMGLVGLFIGPVLMALLVAIWKEWLRQAENDSHKELLQNEEVGTLATSRPPPETPSP
ncbi:AI-2E family transporter [Cellvibrio polysaccharolyticus]|uniref:AI-2E family transporter n=1 Tax=Cellvibrio polysaccharolyticus TaxID=2082724 RepID=A0A928V4X5_9GAMM|nr:AI-2E family transporter [Cellvibrio polysaccharolyticus]MBE8718327.1 AI-2E family transporter [Cellvibrio polysaccharolyticus]